MKLKYIKNLAIFYLSLFMLNGCVEPYEIKQEDSFDDRLVVETVLTNEIAYQTIKLTRTYSLNNVARVVENGAEVKVIEDDNVFYIYEEKQPGVYISKVKYGAKPNKDYKLSILLQSGKKYSSKTMQLPVESNSDFDLIATKGINKIGKEGVYIRYENKNNVGNNSSSYYRFDYSGIYKVVAPNWRIDSLAVVSNSNKPKLVVKNNEIGKICYGEDIGTKTYLRNAKDIDGNAVEPFNLRFLLKDDHRIYYRYSLNVRQYVVTNEAYTYYKILEEFSQSDNLFSGNQPGNIIGNIFSESDQSENVIGFFDVSKVLSKRVFFNYTDFFVKISPLIDAFYFEPCEKFYPFLDSRGGSQPLSLNEMLSEGLVLFLAEKDGIGNPQPGGPYQVVTKNCGDCSAYGDVVKPNFWID
jgi:uncharacterized protein YcfL